MIIGIKISLKYVTIFFINPTTIVFVMEKLGFIQINFRQHQTYGPEEKFNFINLLTKGNCVSLSAVVIHKKIIRDVGYFDESNEIVTAEDW